MLAELHYELLTQVPAAAEAPCVGLAAGARLCQRRHGLPVSLAKKLARVDAAFAVVRHLTRQRASLLAEELKAVLAGGAGEREMGRMGAKVNVLEERKQECIDGNLVCGLAVDSVTDELLFKPGDGGDKHGEQGYIMDTVMGVEGGGVADMIGEELLCKPVHAQGTLGDEVAMKEEVIEDKLDENEVADMMDDESGNREEEGVEGIVDNGNKQG